jgi:hypothetical protein
MGKYTSYTKIPPKPRNLGVHPVMRGIGCIMMVVVPVLAYGLAQLVVDYGIRQRWPLPPEWLQPVTIHPLLLGIRSLAPLWNILLTQNNFIAVLVFTFAIIVVLGSIMAVIYGYMYSMFGPPRYGPQDAPPIRVKVKRYKR